MADASEHKQDGTRRGDTPAVVTAAVAAGEEAFEETGEALSGLRTAIDRAARSLRELSRAGEEWARDGALELGRELRSRGEGAVGGVARQVEKNPFASLAVAFALGILCAAAVRR
jgi:hypothetical protein